MRCFGFKTQHFPKGPIPGPIFFDIFSPDFLWEGVTSKEGQEEWFVSRRKIVAQA